MTYKELLQLVTETLAAHGIPDAKTDARRLFENYTGLSQSRLFLVSDDEINGNDEKVKALLDAASLRAKHIPLQHITGFQDFYGRRFKVSPCTLIPRFDTEILVEKTIELAKTYSKETGKDLSELSILDLCTGTGCIITSLALELNSKVNVGTDLSEEIIRLAAENASDNNAKVKFFSGDLFGALVDSDCENERFDIIVSNPPYIKTSDIDGLSEEVKDHEPMTALDGDEDGLLFYRRIAKESSKYIKKQGLLTFEIGYDQGKEVMDILKQNGFYDVMLFKDLAGLDRVVAGRYGGNDV